jgi:cellulose synthase (UDP-forming)
MLLMYLMPIVALARGQQYADVTLVDFYLHVGLAQVAILALAWCWYRSGWARPVDAKIISWEALLFLFAKWPWLIAGTLAAVRDSLTGSFVDFRITPKGRKSTDKVPLKVLLPYIVLSATSGLAVLVFDNVGDASGFYLFAIINCAIYAILVVAILVRHAIENGLPLFGAPRAIAAGVVIAGVLVALPIAGVLKRGTEALDSIAWGIDGFEVTHATYSATGAGKGGDKVKHVTLVLRWAGADAAVRIDGEKAVGN